MMTLKMEMQIDYLWYSWGSLNVLEIQHVLKGSWLTDMLQLAVVINQSHTAKVQTGKSKIINHSRIPDSCMQETRKPKRAKHDDIRAQRL